VQKWPDCQRGGYSQTDVFFFFFEKKNYKKKNKLKKVGIIWEVLDTIGQIAKN
jgi:hypothetical protein